MYSEQVFLIQTKIYGCWKDDIDDLRALCILFYSLRRQTDSTIDHLWFERYTPPNSPWKFYSVTAQHHLSSKEHP